MVHPDGLPIDRGIAHACGHDVIAKDQRETVKWYPCVHRTFSLFNRALVGIYCGS
jgi:hypothetical protein